MLSEIYAGFERGDVIPYLGPGVLALAHELELPAAPEQLVTRLTAKATVPHKIRNNLTAAAQYHREFQTPQDRCRGNDRSFRRSDGAHGPA